MLLPFEVLDYEFRRKMALTRTCLVGFLDEFKLFFLLYHNLLEQKSDYYELFAQNNQLPLLYFALFLHFKIGHVCVTQIFDYKCPPFIRELDAEMLVGYQRISSQSDSIRSRHERF